jgi:hypothetical protein
VTEKRHYKSSVRIDGPDSIHPYTILGNSVQRKRIVDTKYYIRSLLWSVRRFGWMKHAAHTNEVKNTCNILMETMKRVNHLRDTGGDGRIILI